jgi:hypothetical protein
MNSFSLTGGARRWQQTHEVHQSLGAELIAWPDQGLKGPSGLTRMKIVETLRGLADAACVSVLSGTSTLGGGASTCICPMH